MTEGFLMLDRGMFDHFLWTEPRSYSRMEAWLDFLQTAAFTPCKRMIAGHLIEIPRGGLVASVRYLSDRWKWSNTKVCQFLDLLEAEQMITRQKRQGITVVSLCNYEKYNSQKRQQSYGETTPGRRPGDEREEGKEGKKEISPPNPPAEAPAPPKTAQPAAAKSRVPSTPMAQRIAVLFRRSLSAAWSEKEVKAFKKLPPIAPADMDAIERYYRKEREKGNGENGGLHRRDLLTFLNLFNGELDRARAMPARPVHRTETGPSKGAMVAEVVAIGGFPEWMKAAYGWEKAPAECPEDVLRRFIDEKGRKAA